jgi:DNA polymerase-3 subunit epsilon
MKHKLPLQRPLIIFDLETTGVQVHTDRIIEIAALKLLPGGSTRQLSHRVNPEVPIPPESTAVHGITDADVALEPTFRHLAPKLIEFFVDCDLAGFNVRRFDLPLLVNEFERAGETLPETDVHVIDVQTIFHMKEPRDLSAALRFYCGREHTGAHGALADVLATAEVFEAQLDRYPDLPHDIIELERVVHPKDPAWLDDEGKFVWEGNNVIITFGKHRGTSLRDLVQRDRNYLEWILSGNFSMSVQSLVRDALEGTFPERSQS